MPKVSVITPIYNVADYLPQCLKSLHAQTLDDIEFICVNDGSTDNSLEILQEYAAIDSRFVIIDKPNSGYGHTMNTGLDAARGEYIGIVESDDFVEPCAFEQLYALAKENGACDIVKANHNVYREGGVPKRVKNFPRELCGRVLSPLDADGQRVLNTIPAIWAAIYRRKFLEDNDIRFLETPGAAFQDTGFVFKTWIAADTFYLTHESYLNYRIDNANSSVKSGEKALYVCDEFASIEKFLAARPERHDALIGRITAKKFDTYSWNYERIDSKFRKDFLELTAAEFELSRQNGELDERLFSESDWARLCAIMEDPQAVFAADQRNAAPSAISRIKDLPVRLRDAAETASTSISRIIPHKESRTEEARSKTVSVVIPVYNAEPFLDKLFDSLLSQTHESLQIICVNDGSTDGSLGKLQEYAARDSRVEIISIENSGSGKARNVGIDRANGDYLCFVDADDYLEDSAIARLVDVACEFDLDVVMYGIDAYVDDTHQHYAMAHAAVKGAIPYNEVFRPCEVENFFVNLTGFTVNKLYRMSYFEKLDLRFPSIGAHEDMPFTYAAIMPAKRAYYLDKVLYHYRLERKGSRSDSTDKTYMPMLQALDCMREELVRLGVWGECERNFVNYALSMCSWKFGTLRGSVRRKFYNTLTEGGWLERLGIKGHTGSYFYNPNERRFHCMLLTMTYVELIEDENIWLSSELDEVLGSKTFRLGNVFARPVQIIRAHVKPEDEDEDE
ncbi:MAG: glycosyltransferase [Eggerthellaceae bacterium]|nr:glycosyltransferase [Eggerthellaceae bacterium]